MISKEKEFRPFSQKTVTSEKLNEITKANAEIREFLKKPVRSDNKSKGKISIEKLISGKVTPEEINKLKEDFNEITRSTAIDQKKRKREAPLAGGKTMRMTYGN